MKFVSFFALVLFIISTCHLSAQRTYVSYEGDPTQARIYRLDNGLTVYLSKNVDKPRIQTYFAVRAGSKNDPSDATGLAHYLEHMLFKGTHEMGTLDWDKESVLLEQISDLYEQLRITTDDAKRDEIYSAIDLRSQEAAKYAVPNEYDKLSLAMGAKGTNAYTSLERTVYVNDIPSNELERFLKVESARFRTLVLRLFHTEIETVFEEFNRAQDNDYRKIYYETMRNLFQQHTYGTQTTIGTGEHLKNPSMVAIHNYFDVYYKPNNTALVLVGDLDFDETMTWVEKYYGSWKSAEIPEFSFVPETPISSPRVIEKLGPDKERLAMTFRFDGYHNEDEVLKMQLVDMILNNGAAGLIDLNLVQAQKVLSAGCYPSVNLDYSWHQFYGEPREGQTLDDVRDLILDQIERVKTGEFEDYILEAVIKDLKLNELRRFESNRGRANSFVNAFIMRDEWQNANSKIDKMAVITKAELMEFAMKHYSDNYVIVYKRTGEDKDVVRLKKPTITPLSLDRSTKSKFAEQLEAMPETRLSPIFLDYNKSIKTFKSGHNLDFHYIENQENELFSLYYILDIGSDHDKSMALAIEYLPYLGTSKYSPEEIKKEFFKLGLSYDVFTSSDRIYVFLSGLQESMKEGVVLFEHLLANVEPNAEAYTNLVSDKLKSRADAKLDKQAILWSGLMNYAKYGPKNPFTNRLSADQLKLTTPETLVNNIRKINQFKHRIFYYGPDLDAAVKIINSTHRHDPSQAISYPAKTEYPELATDKTEIYFVDYDMVQAQFVLIAKDQIYDPKLAPAASIFRSYFGRGLSSIVFQEIRESKALAYSAFSTFTTPVEVNKSHYVYGFVGTQADKLPDAMGAMTILMNDMPRADQQFSGALDAVKKKIETDRITKSSIFWNWLSAQKRGEKEDRRKLVYDALDDFSFDNLQAFFNAHIKDKEYKILVLGKKADIDMEALAKFGPIREFTLEELFGY